ncbi:MAG: hypothetical protein ABIK65_12935 [Candidatus Eisenbacteria bacterium]
MPAGRHSVGLTPDRLSSGVYFYIPTAYGTVSAFGSGGEAENEFDDPSRSTILSAADIAAEREESIRSNQDRMAREIAALRSEVEALRREMGGREEGGGD